MAQVSDEQMTRGNRIVEAQNVRMEDVGGYKRLVHSTCGANLILPADRVGCGQGIYTCVEVYRCTDCGVPFHRACAQRHFGHTIAADFKPPEHLPTP